MNSATIRYRLPVTELHVRRQLAPITSPVSPQAGAGSLHCGVEKMDSRWPHKPEIAGSNPAPATFKCKEHRQEKKPSRPHRSGLNAGWSGDQRGDAPSNVSVICGGGLPREQLRFLRGATTESPGTRNQQAGHFSLSSHEDRQCSSSSRFGSTIHRASLYLPGSTNLRQTRIIKLGRSRRRLATVSTSTARCGVFNVQQAASGWFSLAESQEHRDGCLLLFRSRRHRSGKYQLAPPVDDCFRCEPGRDH